MKYIFILLLGFFSVFLLSSNNLKSKSYSKLANKITASTALKLKKEKELYLIGTGGQMMDDIQMMAMSFEYFHQVDVKEGRKLLIFSIEMYLDAINNDNKIHPYLHEYPFTAKNVEIRIWCHNPDGSDVPSDKIYYISSIDGVLSFYIDDPENYSRKTIHEETYEEALQAISFSVLDKKIN